MSDDALICTYVRTPFHFARKGALAEVRPDTLAAHVIAALVERAGIDPVTLEDVIAGCAYPEGPQGNNIARLASMLAGLPQGGRRLLAAPEAVRRDRRLRFHGRHGRKRRAALRGEPRRPGADGIRLAPQGGCGARGRQAAKRDCAGPPAFGRTRRGRRLHPPAHLAGGVGRAPAGLPCRGRGDGRDLLAVDRWRGSRAGGERGLRQAPQPHAAGTGARHVDSGGGPGLHGHHRGRSPAA